MQIIHVDNRDEYADPSGQKRAICHQTLTLWLRSCKDCYRPRNLVELNASISGYMSDLDKARMEVEKLKEVIAANAQQQEEFKAANQRLQGALFCLISLFFIFTLNCSFRKHQTTRQSSGERYRRSYSPEGSWYMGSTYQVCCSICREMLRHVTTFPSPFPIAQHSQGNVKKNSLYLHGLLNVVWFMHSFWRCVADCWNNFFEF